jgi:hypothetical protein
MLGNWGRVGNLISGKGICQLGKPGKPPPPDCAGGAGVLPPLEGLGEGLGAGGLEMSMPHTPSTFWVTLLEDQASA